jgi:hypothetical protein
MANEIKLQYYANATNVYACIRNGNAQVYSFVVLTFVTWNDANIADYAIDLAENGGGAMFYGDFPLLDAGPYTVVCYVGTKISTDISIGSGEIAWNGTEEVVQLQETDWLVKRFRNKTILDKPNAQLIVRNDADDDDDSVQSIETVGGVTTIGQAVP